MDKRELDLNIKVLELDVLLEKAHSVSNALYQRVYMEQPEKFSIKESNETGYLASVAVDCIKKAITYLDENF